MRPNWRCKQINRKFNLSLFKRFRYDEFTLQQALAVYEHFHWRSWRYKTNAERHLDVASGNLYSARIDNWGEMSARNSICASTQAGILKRVRRGVYRFRNWDEMIRDEERR